MKFEEVLPALREGKKIRRECWNKSEYIVIDYSGYFSPIADNTYTCKKGIYLFTGRDNYATYYLRLDDLITGDWEIVKEKKKVKLRDLTKEQFNDYCSKHCEDGSACNQCPFKNVICFLNYYNCWIYHKDLYSDKFLDQEIEIEE